jgi:hypothetical protein
LGYNKRSRKEENTETAEMKFSASVAGHRMNDKIKNTKFWEELNIFILINKIVKSSSPCKYNVLPMEEGRISPKNVSNT